MLASASGLHHVCTRGSSRAGTCLARLQPSHCSRLQCSTHRKVAVAAAATPAIADGEFPVFLSHAGEQKRNFVSCVREVLRAWNVEAFLDEVSMQSGERSNMEAIERALQGAPVVVVVLTQEFVRQRHPMWELGLALERLSQESSDSFVLIPVLQGLTIDDLQHAMQRLYGQQRSWNRYQRPDDATVQSWARMLKAVSGIVCKRDDQDDRFQGAQATHVARRAADVLVSMGRLSKNYAGRTNRVLPMFLGRYDLVGREKELAELQQAVCEHRLVLLRGGPGEGKTVLAHSAGAGLYDQGHMLSGVFEVDLTGASRDLRQVVAASVVPKLKMMLGDRLPLSADCTWLTLEVWLRSLPRDKELLLVLDNIDELIKSYGGLGEAQDALGRLVRDLQTASEAVHALMVSRSNIFMPQRTYAVDIGPMHRSAAGQLLRNTCPNVRLLGSVAEDLADLCGCNATLVVFVGGVLNRRGQGHVAAVTQAVRVRARSEIRVAVAVGATSSRVDSASDPGRCMLEWWKSLLVPYIFSIEELETASGLAVLGDAFSPECAAFVTRGGPVMDGIDSDMFECLTDVLILQPDFTCQQLPTAQESEGAGGGNQLQLYRMQRLHREAAELLLTVDYQDSVIERVQQWVQLLGSAPSTQQVPEKAMVADTPVDWTMEITANAPEGAFSLSLSLSDVKPKFAMINLNIDLNGDEIEFPLKAKAPTRIVPQVREDLSGRLDTFTVQLPNGFQPAAVLVTYRMLPSFCQSDTFYLKLITLKASGKETVRFVGNTYISAEQCARLFVQEDALTNSKLAGNAGLAELIKGELEELRGEGKASWWYTRMYHDRIYCYDIYNDLGGDITEDSKNIRDSLGGSTAFPYPRRLETNRGMYPGNQYEMAPYSALLITDAINSIIKGSPAIPNSLRGLVLAVASWTPWTPQDENFNTVGFHGGPPDAGPEALLSVPAGMETLLAMMLQSNNQSMLRLLGLIDGLEFESEQEVLSLYDRDELARLAEKDGKESVVVPAAGSRDDIGGLLKRKAVAGADVINLNPPKFDVPRSIQYRLSTWSTDEEFGRAFLAGQNPMVLEVLDSSKLTALLADSPGFKEAAPSITGNLEGKSLEGCAAAEQSEAPRLFLVDYWAVYDFLDILEKVNAGSNRVMHAGRCVLFRRSDGHLVPILLELAYSKSQPTITYTPNDPPATWQVAKTIFQSIDSCWHQLISHWLRTHACVEPYLIATRRYLPAVHPIFKLILPHFKHTLHINAVARAALINANGVIETNFSPGPYSMQLSAKVYGRTWRFREEGLVEDLKKRGFLDASGKLRVRDYPYAEDGLLIWGAFTNYFTKYVELYYPSDEAVKSDSYLQDWWNDVTTEAHADALKDGWFELDSRANLVQAISTIAWVASGHHAAVNFGQYDCSGWMPSHSSLCRRPAPARGTKAWEELQGKDLSSLVYFSYSRGQKFEQAMHVAPGHSQARHPIGLCMSGLSALMYALHSHAHLT